MLPRLLLRLAQHPEVLAPRVGFSLVEHAWHLAELEREGFQLRIQRLLHEREPQLADFDGDALARERNYRSRDLLEGARAFLAARDHTVAALARIRGADWLRAGWQDGVGRVVLREMPTRIASHDRAHALELVELLPARDELRAELLAFASALPVHVHSPCRTATAAGPFVAPALVEKLDAPRLEVVAADLKMSKRSLQRRLQAAGLTLRCLIDEARLSVAFESLCRGHSTDRVAMDAGFSDRTALSRALKRWTGTSSRELRGRC
ncbi:MAG: helix-turn-helix domain-containing protein [Archangium sp.]